MHFALVVGDIGRSGPDTALLLSEKDPAVQAQHALPRLTLQRPLRLHAVLADAGHPVPLIVFVFEQDRYRDAVIFAGDGTGVAQVPGNVDRRARAGKGHQGFLPLVGKDPADVVVSVYALAARAQHAVEDVQGTDWPALTLPALAIPALRY